MNLDFLWRLNNHINTLGLFGECYVGNLDVVDSLSVMAMPGGINTTFYDGTRDQDYNVQISAKSIKQQDAVGSLNAIMMDLIALGVLNSTNGSFEFNKFVIENPPSFVTQLETGEFIYELSVTAKLTIFEGAM